MLRGVNDGLRRCFQRCLFGLLAGIAVPAQAANTEFQAPTPAWVKVVEPPAADAEPIAQVRQGVEYLLSDVQVRVDAQGRQQFRHYAMRALNEKGLENIANLEIRFDPAFESLKLHGITIQRGGVRIAKLASAKLRILQREKELDYLIFDGSKTAHVFLDDVRVGDTVEYAYSITGSNPVFAGKQFGQFDLQWSAPVAKLYARLIWPSARPLTIKALNTDLQPRHQAGTEYSEYEWQLNGQTARRLDADTPAWYDPYPAVQWSEYAQWGEVVQWALPLYQTPANLPSKLRAEVERIAARHAGPRERTAEALRLVQREIRYLGVEVGANSHAPNAPALVYARRFGDCKDKTLLLLTLLRALDVQADAALVNTQLRQGIAAGLPRPSAFNHVLVRAKIDGRPYWLDATRNTQPGPLENMGQTSFGPALVLAPQQRDLQDMAMSPAMTVQRNVHVLLDAQAGVGEAATMTVTTTLQGQSAEQQRSALASENRQELQQRYLNFYARHYPGIAMQAPFEVKDDADSNRLELVERYRIDDFWVHEAKRKRREASIEVPELLSYLRAPQESKRDAPLALPHPQELTHVVELRLPEDWTIKSETELIEDPAFVLKREIKAEGRTLKVVDGFRSLRDHVEPAQVADYVAALDRARNLVNYVVYKGDTLPAASNAPAGSFNLPLAMTGLMLTGLWIWIARRLWAWDPAPAAQAPDPALAGMAGWLLLLALSLCLQPLIALRNLLNALPAFGVERWAELTVPGGAAYHPWLAATLMGEMALMTAKLVFFLLLAVLFFRKRRSFAPLYIALMWALLALTAGDHWIASQIPVLDQTKHDKEITELARGALLLTLWTAYLKRSARVRSTFVCQHGATPQTTAATPPLPALEAAAD